MKKCLAISLLVGGVAMGVYAHQITSIAEVNKMNTEVSVQRTAPTAGEQAALRKQGKWLIDDILVGGESAKKYFKSSLAYDIFC